MCVWFAGMAQAETPRDPKNHIKDLNLKGSVKTFKVTPYKIAEYFGKITKGDKEDYWKGDVVVVFDEKGYKIETNRYNKVGQLSSKIVYKHDDKGKRTVRDWYNSYGKLQMKYIYVYDQKGNKIAYNSYKPNGDLNDTYTYKYDAKGKVSEELWTKNDKSFGAKYTFKYDPRGLMSQSCQYTKSENQIDNCTKYKYDKLGRVQETEVSDANGQVLRRSFTKYDDKGNEINIKTFDGSGNFLEEKEYTYKFDPKGNWVERIEYVNHFPKGFVEREITYY